MAKDAKKDSKKAEESLPIVGMLMMGILGAIVVGLSFWVIPFWPQPPSIAPYFGPLEGAAWGLVSGMVTGLVIGYLVDEKHFGDSKY